MSTDSDRTSLEQLLDATTNTDRLSLEQLLDATTNTDSPDPTPAALTVTEWACIAPGLSPYAVDDPLCRDLLLRIFDKSVPNGWTRAGDATMVRAGDRRWPRGAVVVRAVVKRVIEPADRASTCLVAVWWDGVYRGRCSMGTDGVCAHHGPHKPHPDDGRTCDLQPDSYCGTHGVYAAPDKEATT